MNLAHYAKYLLAVLFTVLSGVGAAIADGSISGEEGINLVIVGLGAIVTYVVPNLPSGIGAYLKLIVQALTAGAVVLATVLIGGVDVGEWVQVGVAILGVFTVYVVPNFPRVEQVAYDGTQYIDID